MTFSADDLDESNARQLEKKTAFECYHADPSFAGMCVWGCCEKYICLDCGKTFCVDVAW